MAATTATGFNFRKKVKIKRKGIHAKSNSARSKTSKNYVKINRGQGH